MRDNTISLEGNVVRDVEMQISKAGNSYTRNAIAVEKRKKDGDEWVSEVSFFDFSILDDRTAENFCDSVVKGDRIVITGALEQRTVETDEGEKRSYISIIVESVGPSLRWATTTITKNPKGGAAKGGDDFFE